MKQKMMNLGILAHVDAGKTSVTEQLLYLGGSIRQAGSVDRGTAQTDWLEVERKRGISVKTASSCLCYQGVQINLIDTPGHVDFSGEVERTLGALDCSVLVISAAEGVQPQTRHLWRALEQLGIPTLIFVNKIDRAGCDCEAVLLQIREELGARLFITQTVLQAGMEDCSIEPKDYGGKAREELAALAADLDDAVAELYLADKPIAGELLMQTISDACRQRQLTPVCFGSAKLGVGMEALLQSIIRYLPAAQGSDGAPLSGLVYKVDHDPVLGKGAHIRLFNGYIKSRDPVPLLNSDEPEKATQIRRFNGAKSQSLDILHAGEIAAVYGLGSLKAGDIVGKQPLDRFCPLTFPLLTVQVLPEQEQDLTALAAALQELAEEDPLLDLEWLKEERELHLKITGKIQLEILSELLWDRYRLRAQFSPPSVIYKETPAKTGIGLERYTMPKPCWAVVELKAEPLPRGSGVRFESAIKEKQLPYRYQHHVELSLRDALKQGLYGWEVTDARFTLTGGEHHHVHTHPLDFFVATPIAVLRALTDSGTVLLEPIVRVTLSAGEEFLGKTIRDILQMRGEFDSPAVSKGVFSLEALLPAAASLEYPIAFRSMTSGKGSYYSEFYRYQECPLELGATARRRGIHPLLERSKWILHARSAL